MALSRLYRSQILQLNTRLKALDEINQICIPLNLADIDNSANFHHEFWRFFKSSSSVGKILQFSRLFALN